MDFLPTLWFGVIAVLWAGYLLLEGFDLGVGMHLLVRARTDTDRRVMLNTIGPIWDGNEVWLVVAVAATFAAFPAWYAALLSGPYLLILLILFGLIFRAVAIEYRGKARTAAGTRAWDLALGLGSFVAAFGVGTLLGLTTTGLPLDAHGDRVGGPFAWVTLPALLGGLAVVGVCLVHAAGFLALKTEGPVRGRAGRDAVRMAPVAILPLLAWVLLVQLRTGDAVSWTLAVVALAAGVLGWIAARRRREGIAFAGVAALVALAVAAIFVAQYPVVLPSTVAAADDLTIANAASGDYSLGVMSVITLCALPFVVAYQAWSVWVFRRRIAPAHIPAAHPVVAAVRR